MRPKLPRNSWSFPAFGAFLLTTVLIVAGLSAVLPLSHRPNASALLLSPSSLFSFPRALAPRRANRLSPNQNLIFDPVLAYATFLGGSGGTSNTGAFFVDNAGNSYVAGFTGSQFPTTPGVIGPANPIPGSGSVGLSEVDPTGKSLVFSTYLPGLAEIDALAIDSAGDIYIAGKSICATPVGCPSVDLLPFPTGTTPFQSSPRGIGILKLNSTATAVRAATYLGGSSQDAPHGIASDADGNLYVTGGTSSNDFPTLNPLQGSLGANGENAFVSKFNPALSTLLYSTYLGQDPSSVANAIAVDSSKDAYVAGSFTPAIGGNDFPLTQNAFDMTCSGNLGCGFLSKLSPDGSMVLYSTFAGIAANTVAVDGHGNSFIGGLAQAPYSFSPTLSTCFAIGTSSFVAEINSTGALAFSTCLGGEANHPILGVANLSLDASGNVYAVGIGSSGITLTNPIQKEIIAGSGFVAAINPNTPAMLFSSYFGGADINDTPSGVGVDSSGNIYVAGTDVAYFGQPPLTIFPVFNAMQPVVNTPGCGFHLACHLSSAYLLKIAPTDAPAAALSPGGLSFPVQGVGMSSATQIVTIYDMGSAPLVVSNITVTGDFPIQMDTPCQTTIAAAGGSCAINVSFLPTATGARTGTLTITDNSAGSPHTVQLVGIGGQGAATLSPTTLTFSNQTVGTTSSPQTITLTNSGALSLQISHIQASAPFNETNSCGTSLGPSSVCMISVTFAPTAAGTATGTLTFADSAPDSPQTVALTGNTATQGPPPSIGLGIPSGGSASAMVTAGASATYALAIGGAGMSGTASLTCAGAPTGAVCSVPATVPISSSAVSTFNATVTTTARSHVWFYPGGQPPWLWALAVFGCLVLIQAASGARFPRLRWRLAPLLALTLCACGGGSSTTPTPAPNPNATPAGAYTIVVTAKSGTTTQTQNLTLTVQ